MTFLEIALIALILAFDAMTVSFSAAAAGFINQKRATFRLAFHFGLFQFLMPIFGWFIGVTIFAVIEKIDHWIAFGLLAFIGFRMILEALKKEDLSFRADPSRGFQLIGLSIATSIDALAIGLTLAFVNVNIWYISFLIGLITGSACILAIKIGHILRNKLGALMEVLGGLILIGIGIKILIKHLNLL